MEWCGIWACGKIPIAPFIQVCICFAMLCSDSVGGCPLFFVSGWKPNCGLVGFSTKSPPVGMFSCHFFPFLLEVKIDGLYRVERSS